MRRELPLLFSLLLAADARTPLGAQGTTAALAPGVRVRLWSVDPRLARLPARVVNAGPDTLAIRPEVPRNQIPWDAIAVGDSLVRVPISAVHRLEVSTGQRPRAKGLARGAMLGAMIGGLGGLVIGGMVAASCGDGGEDDMCGVFVLVGPVLGVGAGTAIGGLAGAASPGEYWRRVEIGAR